MIHVKNPGMLTTVQDAGRFGCAHLGISPAGAADRMALRIANRLIGNDENAAALEMTLVGTTLEFEEACAVAIAGGECDCKLGESTVEMWTTVTVPAGGVLACGAMKRGARTYLAVGGGLEVAEILGSASTNLSGGFGGVEGRGVRKGDLLGARMATTARKAMKLKRGANERIYPTMDAMAIRLTNGVQQEWFDAEERGKLFAGEYRVSEESNRSGLRLKGAALGPREKKELLTEGVSLGAMQVPPDGQPIILFVDQQTTGGYPKIANVISADMHRIGQLRPRDEVRFSEVTIAEAVRLLREQEEWFQGIFVEAGRDER
jgi:antagonist of KipI